MPTHTQTQTANGQVNRYMRNLADLPKNRSGSHQLLVDDWRVEIVKRNLRMARDEYLMWTLKVVRL